MKEINIHPAITEDEARVWKTDECSHSCIQCDKESHNPIVCDFFVQKLRASFCCIDELESSEGEN